MANTVKSIGRSSFQGTDIKTITVPASVKKIGNHAFRKCNSLTTITIPGDFKVTKVKKGIEESVIIMSGGKIKTINFNTNFNYEIASYIRGSKWNVRKKDPNYKSIDGIIYTKDGKELVRVPKQVKELNIAEGCEVFCLQATNYYEIGSGSEAFSPCKENIETIAIPSTMKKIDREKYVSVDFDYSYLRLKDISIKAKELDKESISMLINEFTEIDGMVEKIAEQFPNRIKIDDEFCILDDTILLKYIKKYPVYYNSYIILAIPEGIKEIGSEAFYIEYEKNAIYEVILPEGLEKIGDRAFYGCEKIKTINLPESLKSIGSEAFKINYSLTEIDLPSGLESIGTGAFSYSGIKKITIPENIKKLGTNIFEGSALEKVTLPDSMTTVSKRMFKDCYELKEINVPSNLKKIEKVAFCGTQVDIQKFLNCKTLTSIGASAFAHVDWKELTIPAYIKSIGSEAFYNNDYDTENNVIVEGNTSGIKTNAFGYYKFTLTFKEGIKNSFTIGRFGNSSEIDINWIKIKDVDGYEIRLYSDKKCKKIIKKVAVNKNKNSKMIKRNKKYKGLIYVKIRPYKKVKGKKVYGRWSETI